MDVYYSMRKRLLIITIQWHAVSNQILQAVINASDCVRILIAPNAGSHCAPHLE
jgi:hypothetical protein